MTSSTDGKLHTYCFCEYCNGTGIDKTLTVDQKCIHCKGTGARECIE